MDVLGSRVDLNGSQTAMVVRGNIALLMADVTPDNPVCGVYVAKGDSFTEDSFDFVIGK